jgi:integrase
LTAQRGGEVFRMRWQDIDLKIGWWEIPADSTKNGEIHRVPLTPSAVTILNARQSSARPRAEWVFEHVRPSKIPGREAKAGVRRDDVSKVLNHVDRGARATSVYDRYEYDAEKRAALTVWSELLERIVSDKKCWSL